jgi:hypothetical protein
MIGVKTIGESQLLLNQSKETIEKKKIEELAYAQFAPNDEKLLLLTKTDSYK